MRASRSRLFAFLAVSGTILTLTGCAGSAPDNGGRTTPWTPERIEQAGRGAADGALETCRATDCGVRLAGHAAVRSVRFDPATGALTIGFNDAVGEAYWREAGVEGFRSAIAAGLASSAPVDRIELRAMDMTLEAMVPNAYRSTLPPDPTRRPVERPEPRPLVRPIGGPEPPARGLYGRHIALWPSHGWYYERDLDRWEWQRARLFSTVEDVLPTSFVLPFLAPMLEKAGATVWLPRERDTQTAMVLVDNDGSTSGSSYQESAGWSLGTSPGFALGSPPYPSGHNPFMGGTWRRTGASPEDSARWTPRFTVSGDYAVHVSYGRAGNPSTEARYLVRHAGGTAEFAVDQSMAAGTWVYLGTFSFRAGAGPDSASVVLYAEGRPGSVVTADAVRFGGGTGLIERGGAASGRPRWEEAARYHLQFSGMPDTLVYQVSDEVDDYGDDYRSRGEWVNYLRGAPFGPNRDRSNPGLSVPVDLSLAFHTDAGVAGADTTIGTLLIYSSDAADSVRVFPDGMSRIANRDFADMLQTQIVADIRALHDPKWNRRPIWDRDYSEAFRPNVPAALLELLSHQNVADMRYALDPTFRFDVSRAIYKAMTRFLAVQYGEPDPVIQPLPPDHLVARVTSPGRVRVAWARVDDPLEPSARPDRFVVYTRTGSGAYDGGQVLDTTWVDVPVEPGVEVGFRVAGLNDGGEGFPSEEVAALWLPDRPRVLVVSAFDRVSGPALIDVPPFRGFVDMLDNGVADGMDLSFIGSQHEFDVDVPWRDDDDPGHGASYGTHETRIFPGNTRDFAAIHGRAIRASGYGFDTVSDERIGAEPALADGYPVVDVLLGEERETTPGMEPNPGFRAFPEPLIAALRRVAERRGALLVTGSYVGSELSAGGDEADPRTAFAREVLGIRHRTGRAVATGGVHAASRDWVLPGFAFATDRLSEPYGAEAPDAIEPVDGRGRTLLRYDETNMSAAVGLRAGHAAVTIGFPFETIQGEGQRARIMAALLSWLTGGETPDED